jgi:hypothetical protein
MVIDLFAANILERVSQRLQYHKLPKNIQTKGEIYTTCLLNHLLLYKNGMRKKILTPAMISITVSMV